MKRLIIAVGVVLLVLGMALMVFRWARKGPDAPRFVRTTPSQIGGFRLLYFKDNNGFQNDEIWLHTRGTTTDQTNFLFDLKAEKIAGELINGTAIAFNQDESKLLCERWESPETPLMRIASPWIQAISFGKIDLQNTNVAITVWLLDLQKHTGEIISRSVMPVGKIASDWKAAPGGRFVYCMNRVMTNFSGPVDVFQIFDFETGQLRKIQLKGRLYDWRDDHQIVIKNEANDVILFDALTERTNVLFDHQAIEKFSSEAGASSRLQSAFLMPHEIHGDLYLYFGRNGGGGVLARSSPGSTNLTVAMPHCTMNPGSQTMLDSAMRFVVYWGPTSEPWIPGKTGVFLHGLTNDDVVPLVPAEPGVTMTGQKFYHDKVIYRRDDEIWRIDMNGSNNVRLFPPQGK